MVNSKPQQNNKSKTKRKWYLSGANIGYRVSHILRKYPVFDDLQLDKEKQGFEQNRSINILPKY